MNSSPFETVRLNTATRYPWSFMFKTRFWPITARPISPMSQLSFCIVGEAVLVILLYRLAAVRGGAPAFLYVIALTGVTDSAEAFVTQKPRRLRHRGTDGIERL